LPLPVSPSGESPPGAEADEFRRLPTAAAELLLLLPPLVLRPEVDDFLSPDGVDSVEVNDLSLLLLLVAVFESLPILLHVCINNVNGLSFVSAIGDSGWK
jgi:hypothetical protein